jgi:esterase
MTLQRGQLRHDGLTLSYLDAGGTGKPIIALHAHWMEGATYAPLAAALWPKWRVVALDQRGHGHSDHATSYTRDDYVGDLAALYTHLGIAEAVLLGNSLGGVNAYQFAARYPTQVRALVIEDTGAVVQADASFVLSWGGAAPSRAALGARVGPRFLPYLEDSFRETTDGWTLAFDPRDMVLSQGLLNGDHWTDWLATDCPALLIHGRQSRLTDAAHLDDMAARRAHTRLLTLAGGHVVHLDAPAGFAEGVRSFLQNL